MKKKTHLRVKYYDDIYARKIENKIKSLGADCSSIQGKDDFYYTELVITKPVGKGSRALIKKIEELVSKGGPIFNIF